MGVVVEEGACGWPKRAAQGVFRRWEAQSGVSGSSGAAGAGPWAARSHSTTRTLLPPKTPLLDLNLAQISCSSDPATFNYPQGGCTAAIRVLACAEDTISFQVRNIVTYWKRRSSEHGPCPRKSAPCRGTAELAHCAQRTFEASQASIWSNRPPSTWSACRPAHRTL